MTKVILSTGDKYVIDGPSAKIMQEIDKGGWIKLDDNGRDIAVRACNIIAIEDYTNAIIKEATESARKSKVCDICGRPLADITYHFDPEAKTRFCNACWRKRIV